MNKQGTRVWIVCCYLYKKSKYLCLVFKVEHFYRDIYKKQVKVVARSQGQGFGVVTMDEKRD